MNRRIPYGFNALDDADAFFAVPEERNCEEQLGDIRFGFYHQSEYEKELEKLMFKDLKIREIPFIIVCRDLSSISPFIVQ